MPCELHIRAIIGANLLVPSALSPRLSTHLSIVTVENALEYIV
jgi:hypothetical protein